MSETLTSLPILVFATDDAVVQEIRGAIRDGVDSPVLSFAATSLPQAIDVARDRQPHAAMMELTGDAENDRSRVNELRSILPSLIIVGIYAGESASAAMRSADMVSLVRAGVSDFVRRPLAAAELNQLLERLTPDVVHAEPAQVGTCVAMISNKGGVGKSTLSVNIGVALAKKYPGEVLLVDTSLQMGVCAPMLNLNPETTLFDAYEQRKRLDSTLIEQLATPHDSGLLMLAAPRDPIAAADIDDQCVAQVLNLARRTFRFVVVDTFPLFDQTIMSVLDVASRAYVVLDNVVPTVLSAVQLLSLLDNLQYSRDRVRVIVNRHQQLPGNPLIDDVARSLRMDVDHVIPYDKRVITSANLGQPIMADWVKLSKVHRAIHQVVEEIEALAASVEVAP